MSDVDLKLITGALERSGLIVEVRGAVPETVSGVADDSRLVTKGALFIAVRGSTADGHEFLDAAAAAGASVAIIDESQTSPLPAIVVNDGRRAAAVAAAAYYGEPTRGMRFVGVTGTNGKTTTVGLLRHVLDSSGARCASIGTLGVLIGTEAEQVAGGGGLTTPGPVELQRLLRVLSDASVRTVVMEVSSHALAQRRVEGIRFDVAVFTNFTRDHLDYHGTTEAYSAAKASLLGYLKPDGVAVRNVDDPEWRDLRGDASFVNVGIKSPDVDVTALDIRFTARGSAWTLSAFGETRAVRPPLIGDFNVANALCAAAAALALGRDMDLVAVRLGTSPQVPGRLEILSEHPTVLRDYAHTPDALERALTALRPFTSGKLIVVFGAGGDRDRGKRPLMGQVADRCADTLIVTSDNPRTEEPEAIIDEIVAPLAVGRFERIEDRRAAIERAIAVADPERDVVLLAGKGHETYQVRGTTRHPFDEKKIVRELLAERERRARG